VEFDGLQSAELALHRDKLSKCAARAVTREKTT
jgi:hypothetical protein